MIKLVVVVGYHNTYEHVPLTLDNQKVSKYYFMLYTIHDHFKPTKTFCEMFFLQYIFQINAISCLMRGH